MKKPDFYTLMHKCLRRRLFLASSALATIDFNDKDAFGKLKEELTTLFARLKKHAYLEDTHFHPLIQRVLPTMDLDAQHLQLESSLCDLKEWLETLSSSSQKIEPGAALYHQYNDFLGHYLQHLAEEERIMPELRELCSVEELNQAHQALLASFTPEDMKAGMEEMLLSLNPGELTAIRLVGRKANG